MLVSKFVDSEAEFIFVAADMVLEKARELDAVPLMLKALS